MKRHSAIHYWTGIRTRAPHASWPASTAEGSALDDPQLPVGNIDRCDRLTRLTSAEDTTASVEGLWKQGRQNHHSRATAGRDLLKWTFSS